jgi:hypothetical protein
MVDNWFGTGNTFCAVGVDDGRCATNAAVGCRQFGRGYRAGASLFNFDFSIGKRFVGRERSIAFRTEFFNAFNHASFDLRCSLASLPTMD